MQEYKNTREYADWITKKAPCLGMIPFLGNKITNTNTVSGLTNVLWHRKSQFQTQLFIAEPNVIIPKHKHPDVDEVMIWLGGQAGHYHEGERLTTKFLRDNVDTKTGESKLEDKWFKLHSKGDPQWWVINSDQMPSMDRLTFGETKANVYHGTIFGPGGGCYLLCQHWLNGVKPTSIEDNTDVKEPQTQESLTWKDAAYNEEENSPFYDEDGEQIKIEE